MALPFSPDSIDWQILDVLQSDGRISIAALSRVVRLSPTATNERVNRLEQAGVITGYRAVLAPERLGLALTAYIRMRPFKGSGAAFRRALASMTEVLECHHTTGEDCFLMKVVARDMPHLEEITETVAAYGETTTSVVYSSPVDVRALAHAQAAEVQHASA